MYFIIRTDKIKQYKINMNITTQKLSDDNKVHLGPFSLRKGTEDAPSC